MPDIGAYFIDVAKTELRHTKVARLLLLEFVIRIGDLAIASVGWELNAHCIRY